MSSEYEKRIAENNIRLSWIAFYALTALGAFCVIFCFIKAIGWINRPFPGFLPYYPPYVGSFSSRDWPGKKAGIRYLDCILEVDGRPVRLGSEVLDIAKSKAPGGLIQYAFQRKDRRWEVSLPGTLFSLKDFILVFLAPYLCGAAIFVLGVIAYALKPNTRTSLLFLVMCFGLGIYGITGFEIHSSFFLVRLHYLVLSVFPSCFFHLGLIFPERKKILERFPALEYLIYLPAVVAAIAYQVYFSTLPEITGSRGFGWVPTYIGLSLFARIFVLLGFVTLVALVLHSYFRPVSSQARQRAKMMMFGVGIAFIPPGVLTLSVIAADIYFPFNFIPFFTIFFPVSIAYAIVRHNLFDADALIRRTAGYFLVTAIVIGAYALISVFLNVSLGQYQLAQSKMFPILFTVGVILVFNPLRDRVQAVVDRLFFRKEYEYGSIVEKIGNAMTSLLDLDHILKRLARTFQEELFINTSSVMLASPDGATFRVALAEGEREQEVQHRSFRTEDPLIEIIKNKKQELTRYDVLEDPEYREVSQSCVEGFNRLSASLIIPLVYQDKVIGAFNLGEKKSGKFYNREDVELLRTIAHQGAVAIENARLFQENLEKQRMEEELNIARDLQMSMLPATCPDIRGFQVSARSIPAREVGGDFFDFIEMGDNRLGFVIGDVTGKSVSGALVMAASRSIFRMLSETEVSVGEIMRRANRRTKKDIKTGMFVALLYAVLDPGNGSLSLCSAGQTQPIHLSARTGEAILVETEGDTFPLGILEEADYRETQLKLAAGDKVIFYTDGIVEAMNEQEEIFGFERLIEVVKGAGSLDAESVLKEILDKVNDFVGGAAQHDDLTVIVVTGHSDA